MKKFLLIALVLVVALSACDRKVFVKKLVGTWKLSSYLYSGIDQTSAYDTTKREYQLTINDDKLYTESWKNYAIHRDSFIRADTLSVDTNTTPYTYTVKFDTLRFLDTVITPHLGTGKWDLLNSEEDLQLRDDSDAANPKIYRILTLDKSHLNLLKGNEEWHLKK